MTIALLAALVLLGGCSSWCRVSPPLGSISGRVVDPQDRAVEGVELRLGNRVVGVTDRNGAFVIRAVPTNDRLAVSFSAPTFMRTTRIYEPSLGSRGNTIVIWPRATPSRLQVSKGGTLAFRGGTIVFPPDALVDSEGRRLTGDVEVTMSVLDITDQRQLASAPGDFTAQMRDGTVQNLETFGLFELVAESYGRAVKFAPGKAATVELDAPKEMPAMVPSFRFDERTGRWNQQTAQWRSAGPRIFTTIDWLDWWNADMPFVTTCLAVDVLGCRTCEGAPSRIAGATVTASPSGYFGSTYSKLTDQNGPVCLPVKMGAHAQINVVYNNHASNPLIVATDPSMLDPNTCTNCPLVTVTHVVAGPVNETLTMEPSSGWCASDYWNQNEFESAWLKDLTHLKFSNLGMTLTLNEQDAQGNDCDPVTIDPNTNKKNCRGAEYAGAEYKTLCYHGYGTYTATIAPPQPNPGMVTGFFVMSKPGDDNTVGENGAVGWDEIDIELLGRAPKTGDIPTTNQNAGSCVAGDLIVQTNYFAKGNGNHEKAYCLPPATYTYRFIWSASTITWEYQDQQGWHPLGLPTTRGSGAWPTQPGRVIMNLWANNSNLSWVGKWAYNGPRTATFSNVTVTHP
ncbi:MAG TPA: family 16 glycosylhydrolase [Thermoanaerobaculia bacterium]|nr:family 16 glycosylhydrolase [Thermoanaerobaculia bacterium]